MGYIQSKAIQLFAAFFIIISIVLYYEYQIINLNKIISKKENNIAELNSDIVFYKDENNKLNINISKIDKTNKLNIISIDNYKKDIIMIKQSNLLGNDNYNNQIKRLIKTISVLREKHKIKDLNTNMITVKNCQIIIGEPDDKLFKISNIGH